MTCCHFLKFTSKIKFDVITLWFVIEHFANYKILIKKINQLIKPGGVLGISTPNGKGLSARFNSVNFLETSPLDHYFIFTPKSMEEIFSRFGFKTLKCVNTGIHYTRFKQFFPKLSIFLPKKIYQLLAKLFNLGDTFEMYFRKK